MNLLLTLLFLLPNATTSDAPADNWLNGNWYFESMNRSKVYMYKAPDGLWYGKIVYSTNAAEVGKIIFKEGKYDNMKEVCTGKLVYPNNVVAKISKMEDGKIQIKSESLLSSKTFLWEKIE